MKKIVLLGLVWVVASMVLSAQKTTTKAESITATGTVQAIDKTTRLVTLRNEKGEDETLAVGPSVTRFDQLNVGDKVKMTYYESLVFQVLKPGQKSSGESSETALSRVKGLYPGGTVATQEKRTVTVKAIDPAIPSITVTFEDGRTVVRKVENPKNLEGIKPGDRIDITYTQALLASVEPAQ